MDTVAIIGAGMAGLTAAQDLHAAGRTVCVFDKSRGLGGRLATRRTDLTRFDHGAPVAQGDAAFDAAMKAAGAHHTSDGWRGAFGMSSLVKSFADGIELRRATRIATVSHDGGWHLGDTTGTAHGPFDALAIAIPAPQLAELVPSFDLSTTRMSARWTLLAVWPDLAPPPAAGPFEAIIDQSDRPGAAPGTVVAHASADWTASNLEYEAEDVAIRLGTELGRLADTRTGPLHARAHRWRYARTAAAFGAPFVEIGPGGVAGGDWALGPDAGHAWHSGRAMAQALLAG